MSAHRVISDLSLAISRVSVRDGYGFVVGTTDPTSTPGNSVAGYVPGCLYLRVDSSPKLYINTGTVDSTTWTVVGAQS